MGNPFEAHKAPLPLQLALQDQIDELRGIIDNRTGELTALINANKIGLAAFFGLGGILGLRAAGRIPYFDASGNLTSGLLLFDGSLLTLPGDVSFTQTLQLIKAATADGSDNAFLVLCGGGSNSTLRGARFEIGGNEAGGGLEAVVGNAVGAKFQVTGPATVTQALTASGGAVFAGGGTNLNYYEEGTFPATLTGVTTTVTGTCRYIRIGSSVTLFFPGLTGTSNSTGCTITGVPSAIRPARTQTVTVFEVYDNNIGYACGAFQLDTTSTITIFFKTTHTANNSSTFTNAATLKGASPASFAYSLQ